MRIGGPRWLGPLLLVSALAGCTDPVDPAPPERGDMAVAFYRPPEGVPAFCRLLAGSGNIDDLPHALGTLTTDPEDRAAREQVSGAHAELEAVLVAVPDDERYDELSAQLEDLLGALRSASEDPVDGDGDVRIRISAGLDRVGALVQPVCEFPT